MKDQLQIALIQSDLIWEHPKENRTAFHEKIQQVKAGTDLIVLPEMFTTGFTMNAASVAETMEGETVAWMRQIAREKEAAVTGSLVISEDGHYYNRSVFAYPSGEIAHYDKKHTFTLAGEDTIYTAGTVQQIVAFKGWKLCLLICYDLRFPVWARNTQNYDALFYVASWPEPRIAAWDTLLKARAIENMCYTIGVNRVGVDANGHHYPGHSAVYDVLGRPVVFSKDEEIVYAELHKDHIRETREKYRFLEDRDHFTLA